MGWEDLKMQARQGRGPLKFARPAYRALQRFRLPMIRPVFGTAFAISRAGGFVWQMLTKILWREPMFRHRCENVGRGLILEGSVPQFFGNGRITVGDDVRIGARNTWIVGFKVSSDARLIIGDRVSINYQTIISAASTIRIGNDTMIAGGVQIYDNPSHPLSPARRLLHESFTMDEVEPVTIGDNVWIGHSAIIMRGVEIGDGSVVAAHSVVTRSVPARTLVAGVPAREIRSLED